MTDGYISGEQGVFDYIRENLNQCNVFSFGIGSSVNRYLVEGVAKAGMGEPFIVTQASEAAAIATKFREYIQTPVLTNIQMRAVGFILTRCIPCAPTCSESSGNLFGMEGPVQEV